MIVLNAGEDGSVPVKFAQQLEDDGFIAPAETAQESAEKAANELRGEYKLTHIKFGEFLIEGPGVELGTKIKGKKDAETFVDGIIAARLGQALGEDDDV